MVGARCGGAPAAMLFARAGLRVLLLERASRLGDTLSTLYIQPAGVRLLDSWGLLDTLKATGCPPITGRTITIGDVTLTGTAAPAYAPRRSTLDPLLASAAAAAGAGVRYGWSVRSVRRTRSGTHTIHCRTPDGPQTVQARLVVGADGMRSRVAAEVGARDEVWHPTRSCAYYTYWSGVSAQFEAYSTHGASAGCFPTQHGATLVVAYFRAAEFARVRTDPLRAYLDQIRLAAPVLADRLAAATRLDRMYGTGHQPNYLRTAAGDGWALVGDAGHHKDSLTAQGITDAFVQAQLLAEHATEALCTARPLTAALRGYAEARDRLLTQNFETTLHLATLDLADDLSGLRAAAADPVATAEVLAAFGGAYPAIASGVG